MLRRAPQVGPAPPPRVESPLDRVNDDFHETYEGARGAAQGDGPVFIVIGDALLMHRAGIRRERNFSPRRFHVIKSAVHAPVAVYIALHRIPGAPVDAETTGRLTGLARHVDASLATLGEDAPEDVETLQPILHASRAMIDEAIAAGVVHGSRLDEFAAAVGPALRHLTDVATDVQLSALHAHVEEALGEMSGEERRALQVVVVGNHQARIRSLAMQYFQKRFREASGVDDRVAYAEGITDEQATLALVGARRLDRAIAAAFFGDPRRMQRDLLGDSAAARLAQLDLKPIE